MDKKITYLLALLFSLGSLAGCIGPDSEMITDEIELCSEGNIPEWYVGCAFPSFEFEDQNGTHWNESSANASGRWVAYFSASWCTHCKPTIDALDQSIMQHHLLIFNIYEGNDHSNMTEWQLMIEDELNRSVNRPFLHAPSLSENLSISPIPHVLLIDNNTIISARIGLWDSAHEMSMWFNATSPQSGYTQTMDSDMDGMDSDMDGMGSDMNNNSSSGCWEILQISTEHPPYDGTIVNNTSSTMTYDSDCRLIGIVNGDNVGFGFENTTYDSDGNIDVVLFVISGDQGATWVSFTVNYTYSGGLLMQTESFIPSFDVNYTYDSDDRVIVENKSGQMAYLNTTYDSDGNIASVESSYWSVGDVPPRWYSMTTNYTYSGGLLMQANQSGSIINYTYDLDDRVIVVTTMGPSDSNLVLIFTNTSYDLDGNIAVVETSMNHGGGTWKHTFQRYLWGEP